MVQDPLAIASWECVLTHYMPKRIVELGTGAGGLSLYFHLWCENNDARLYTLGAGLMHPIL